MPSLIPVAAGAAFAYGFGKAKALNAHGGFEPLSETLLDAAGEEAVFRLGLERLLLRNTLGVSLWPARLLQAVAFAAIHPGREVETGLAGIVYSWLYEKAATESGSELMGLVTSTAAHTAHNFGIQFGARR